MYGKIEPSGVCERKGMVQVRLSFFLNEKDYGYEKHHVELPVIPEGGYPGEVNEVGMPINQKDYDKWLDKLPKVWQNNPFHNHFIQVEPTTTDKEIIDIAEAFLHEAGVKWSTDSRPDLTNNDLPFKKPLVVTNAIKSDCKIRAEAVKQIITEVKV